MTEAETSIQESLLNTLSFLASETKQREFASKVFYSSYQDEFACWWFDTFHPNEPNALRMFNEAQLTILTTFSATFDRTLVELGSGERTIDQLLQEPEWKNVVTSASAASAQLARAT